MRGTETHEREGRRAMSKSTWTGAVNSDWDDPDNWSPAGIPGVNSDVVIATGVPVASASIGTVNSITDSADLSFESAGTNTVTTFLDNTGSLNVDHGAGEGGTTLNVGGTLTNGGSFSIGNTTLSASDEVTAAGLDNIKGKLQLFGSGSNQALLDVTAGSAGFGTTGVVRGYVRLVGDSAIEFESGEITSLAAHTQLHLNGNDAFIEDSTALGSNSALTGLASIGDGAIFALHNNATVSTSGALDNKGDIRLDFVGGDGGSSLTVGGTLTVSNVGKFNAGELDIGNTTLSASDKVTATALDNSSRGTIQLTGSSANQTLLDVTSGAGFGTAGVLSGYVTLAGDSAIEFASGQITSLTGSLYLTGSDAFVEDSTALGSNSALTGLASIAAGVVLGLGNGASLSTTGSVTNSGGLDIDEYSGGGVSLTVAGTLTNTGMLLVDYENGSLSSSNKVTADTLSNSGTIDIGGETTGRDVLDVTMGVAGFGTAGTLTGSVTLGDNSAIEFASGQISTLAASAFLFLSGNDAFIEDSTAPDSNSALMGLASISAGAGLDLQSGASVTTTGSLVNDGDVYLNYDSTLSIGGTLTNNGSITFEAGTFSLAGAVSGTGSFGLEDTNLQFDSSVSAGQSISDLSGADELTLEQAQSFAGTISGFGTGDTIDAANFLLSGTTFNFVENSGGTGGTLTLHDASLTANILMTGKYSNSDFTLAPDSGTGTLVKYV
jgi:hypothetical protein